MENVKTIESPPDKYHARFVTMSPFFSGFLKNVVFVRNGLIGTPLYSDRLIGNSYCIDIPTPSRRLPSPQARQS